MSTNNSFQVTVIDSETGYTGPALSYDEEVDALLHFNLDGTTDTITTRRRVQIVLPGAVRLNPGSTVRVEFQHRDLISEHNCVNIDVIITDLRITVGSYPHQEARTQFEGEITNIIESSSGSSFSRGEVLPEDDIDLKEELSSE